MGYLPHQLKLINVIILWPWKQFRRDHNEPASNFVWPKKKFADTLLDECSRNVYIALIHARCSGWVSKVNSSVFYVSYNDNIPANFFWDISVRFLSWECWDFWRRHDHFWRFPKKSEVFWRSPKSSDDVRSLPKTSEVCRRRS